MSRFRKLAGMAALLALCVIVLGAWVRLSDAGLGCPDWPGCYGQATWPEASHEVERANAAFPERPVESHKAWKEMVHRYLAGILGLLVLALAIMAWRNRRQPYQPVKLPMAILVLVIFQALLGMWTVTLLLKPAIVMAHLLGGMLTFSLLVWLYLRTTRQRAPSPPAKAARLRPWLILGVLLLSLQIALGGWVSTNYASLACTDLPQCAQSWWPEADFREGFVLWREVGVDYEGGVLDAPARIAIHLSHRIGAVVMLLYLGLLGIRMWRTPSLDINGRLLLLLLTIQLSLGVLNIVLLLPLWTAVAHTGFAALLLASLLLALHRVTPRRDL